MVPRRLQSESLADLATILGGERNASFRMVLGYWDMADPFLDDMRAASAEPDFCRHLEAVVMADPNAEAIVTRRCAAIRAAAQARRASRIVVRPGPR